MDPTRLVGYRWPQGTYSYGIRGGHTIASLSMVFGCGNIVDTLPYASALLEESLAFIKSV